VALVLPINTKSLAKNMLLMLWVARLTPRPEEFSLEPRSLIKMKKRSGDKLQPKSELVRFFFNVIYILTLIYTYGEP
jgi:hypothetical protein